MEIVLGYFTVREQDGMIELDFAPPFLGGFVVSVNESQAREMEWLIGETRRHLELRRLVVTVQRSLESSGKVE